MIRPRGSDDGSVEEQDMGRQRASASTGHCRASRPGDLGHSGGHGISLRLRCISASPTSVIELAPRPARGFRSAAEAAPRGVPGRGGSRRNARTGRRLQVPDGRYLAGMTGRLVELFTDGVPTVCMSLYLSPHTLAVAEALRVARSTGLPVPVVTIAEAVGSDDHVVRSCAGDGRFGAAAQALSAYLDSDLPVAVSDYTRDLIISSAEESRLPRYPLPTMSSARRDLLPAINAADYLGCCRTIRRSVLDRRRLIRNGYVLFLSRLARAKGVDDLIAGFTASPAAGSSRS